MPEGDQRNIREKSKDYWSKIRKSSEKDQRDIGGKSEGDWRKIRVTSEEHRRDFGEDLERVVGKVWGECGNSFDGMSGRRGGKG